MGLLRSLSCMRVLSRSYTATLRGVLAFIGLVGIEDMPTPPPRLERQASELSRDWEQRYRAAIESKAIPVPQKTVQAVARLTIVVSDGLSAYLIRTTCPARRRLVASRRCWVCWKPAEKSSPRSSRLYSLVHKRPTRSRTGDVTISKPDH